TPEHEAIARQAQPTWQPSGELANDARAIWCKLYGLTDFADLFTPRQLVALTTFSDLVAEAREQVCRDALAAGLPDDDTPLREGGAGARAYAEAVSVYVAFAVGRGSDYWSTIATPGEGFIRNTFARQAIPMTWDFAEANPFSDSTGNWIGAIDWITRTVANFAPTVQGFAVQQDAMLLTVDGPIPISTDPPYYDNIGYADLSDYFYVWLRPALRSVYPELFDTLLVPKSSELIASPYRFNGSGQAANDHFEGGLLRAFSRMREVIQPEYPLTVFYAFKQEEVA